MSDLFTPQQQILLAVTPIFSGVLSAIGSFTIIRLIFRERRHPKQAGRNTIKGKESKITYERIMIGLSIFDILNSLKAMTSTFLMPSDTPGVWQAHGNTATCTIQGFVGQLGLATALYSASLALYFVLRIHPDTRGDTIQIYYEPFLHAIPILFALVTAIAGIFLESYNPLPLGVGCWVAAYPMGCDSPDSTIECTRGKNAKLIMWIFGGYVTIISYIIIIISMLRIYYLVRNQLSKMERRYSSGSLDIEGKALPTNASKRLRKVSTQAFLYIGAFFLAYIWPSLSRIFESEDSLKRYFVLSLCSSIFYPLQGFLNLFIYIGPRLRDVRKQYPAFTWWDRIIIVFHFETLETVKINKKLVEGNSRKTTADPFEALGSNTVPPDPKCNRNNEVGDGESGIDRDESSLVVFEKSTELSVVERSKLDDAKELT